MLQDMMYIMYWWNCLGNSSVREWYCILSGVMDGATTFLASFLCLHMIVTCHLLAIRVRPDEGTSQWRRVRRQFATRHCSPTSTHIYIMFALLAGAYPFIRASEVPVLTTLV